MNSNDILDMVGDAKGTYVWDAQEVRSGSLSVTRRRPSIKRTLLIAAMIALMILLVGCTVAYVQGWFTEFFAARSKEPLSSEQIEYIQENEQIVMETQANNGWTVELKSTMCDGKTGYIIFGVTAPADIDLEGANYNDPNYYDCIIPGNGSSMVHEGRNMFSTSMGIYSEEYNIIWQYGDSWEEDNDAQANTMNYVIKVQAENGYSNQPILLENPFGSDVEFYICFDNFVHAWEDQEIRKAIDKKYAGQDYMIDGEEMEGLYKSEVLVEGEWEFTVTFDVESPELIELISEPVIVEAIVSRKVGDEPLFYETKDSLEQIKLTSFVLKPLGAELMFEQEEDVLGAFFEYQNDYWYGNRDIFVVMKDGSKIALHTQSSGNNLTAETPIVLGEVDYVLMGDGTKLYAPK